MSTEPRLLPTRHAYHQKAAQRRYKLIFLHEALFSPLHAIPISAFKSQHTQHTPSYLIGKVQDDEGGVGHAGLLEVLAAGVPVVQLLCPVLVSAFGNLDGEKMDKNVAVRHAKEVQGGCGGNLLVGFLYSAWATGIFEKQSPPPSSRSICYFIFMYILTNPLKNFFQ